SCYFDCSSLLHTILSLRVIDIAITNILTLSLHVALPICARDEFEGEERDEIDSRIKVRFAEQRAAKAQREKEVADTAWDYFARGDRKSTRLNSSHVKISYAVFCLKKKNNFKTE